MKLFLDTADITVITAWYEKGIIDGVTTNPTHLARAGVDPKQQILQICARMPDGDVSVEVTEVEPEKVYEQAKAISQLARNITVKIPCHLSYYPVIKRLVYEEVPINITLVFTLIQGLLMAKMGVKYISPFVGRWDDIDMSGLSVLYDLRTMIDRYGYKTEILAASIRGVTQVSYAIQAGVDVVTVPPAVLEKMTTHVLTEQGITQFNKDWASLNITRFP